MNLNAINEIYKEIFESLDPPFSPIINTSEEYSDDYFELIWRTNNITLRVEIEDKSHYIQFTNRNTTERTQVLNFFSKDEIFKFFRQMELDLPR